MWWSSLCQRLFVGTKVHCGSLSDALLKCQWLPVSRDYKLKGCEVNLYYLEIMIFNWLGPFNTSFKNQSTKESPLLCFRLYKWFSKTPWSNICWNSDLPAFHLNSNQHIYKAQPTSARHIVKHPMKSQIWQFSFALRYDRQSLELSTCLYYCSNCKYKIRPIVNCLLEQYVCSVKVLYDSSS